MLRIGPFNYDPIRGVDLWLAQSDEFLLTHLSTSPEVEPPHFTKQVGGCICVWCTCACSLPSEQMQYEKKNKLEMYIIHG